MRQQQRPAQNEEQMTILLHISSTHTYHEPIFRQLAFGEKEREVPHEWCILSPTPVSGLAEQAHDELKLSLEIPHQLLVVGAS